VASSRYCLFSGLPQDRHRRDPLVVDIRVVWAQLFPQLGLGLPSRCRKLPCKLHEVLLRTEADPVGSTVQNAVVLRKLGLVDDLSGRMLGINWGLLALGQVQAFVLVLPAGALVEPLALNLLSRSRWHQEPPRDFFHLAMKGV